MMLNDWVHSGGASDDLTKLGGGETTEYRHHAIMPSDRMKSERKTRKPEPCGGDATAAKVGNDDAPAGDAIELTDHRGEVVVGKVMEQLRAHHDVNAVIAKGQ